MAFMDNLRASIAKANSSQAVVRDDVGGMPTASSVSSGVKPSIYIDPTGSATTPIQNMVTGYQTSSGQYTGASSAVIPPVTSIVDQQTSNTPDAPLADKGINWMLVVFVVVVVFAVFYFSSSKK